MQPRQLIYRALIFSDLLIKNGTNDICDEIHVGWRQFREHIGDALKGIIIMYARGFRLMCHIAERGGV